MLDFHSLTKEAAFNAVYMGDLSDWRLEVKILSPFSQHLHKSTFLCLCTELHPLHKKGIYCLLAATVRTARIKRRFCKRKCFGISSLVAVFSPGLRHFRDSYTMGTVSWRLLFLTSQSTVAVSQPGSTLFNRNYIQPEYGSIETNGR